MLRSKIAARNAAVLLPGLPNALAASGSGSPSVCARSYLEIPQLVAATPTHVEGY
jgi:hypothetical protein